VTLSPPTPLATLDQDDLRALADTMDSVLRTAVRLARADLDAKARQALDRALAHPVSLLIVRQPSALTLEVRLHAGDDPIGLPFWKVLLEASGSPAIQ
jgi:hypothetical protein